MVCPTSGGKAHDVDEVETTAETTNNDEYDVRIGIQWTGHLKPEGQQPLMILNPTAHLHACRDHRECRRGRTRGSPLDYYWHVHDLARDCVNQGGVENVLLIRPPARESDT